MRYAGLLLLILPTLATAAQPRDLWSFAWDPHPQAALIDHFDLEICLPTADCTVAHIPGGTTTKVSDIVIADTPPGAGTAVLRACPKTGACSANSNTVVLDRSAPLPPTQPQFNP